MSDRKFIDRILDTLTSRVTTFRLKILLIAVPILVLTSIAYTLDAITTERSIIKNEILKKAEVVTDLASRMGELPLISENPDLVRKVITYLRGVSDVTYVAFYDKNVNLLATEGADDLMPRRHPETDMDIMEQKDIFDLCTPIFIVRAGEDIDVFQEVGHNTNRKERIGWVRIGFSKASMQKAEQALIYRALFMALAFITASSILVYKLASAATRPLRMLSRAAESMRKGTYPELAITSNDEIGTLTSEFNSMSSTIREREDMLKASLNEKELLLREIHHRVKNNMQIISSLLNLQSSYVKENKYLEMFNESRNRIKSMALVHEKLYQSTDLANIDLKDYVNTLVNSLISFYEKLTKKISLTTDIDDISIGIDTAIPCGLIINELVTNSLKHAFPDGKEGNINLILRKNEGAGATGFTLIIRDNGIGIPEGMDIKNTDSLGLKLVTTLIEDQLQGSFELKKESGTEFRISFRELEYKKRI